MPSLPTQHSTSDEARIDDALREPPQSLSNVQKMAHLAQVMAIQKNEAQVVELRRENLLTLRPGIYVDDEVAPPLSFKPSSPSPTTHDAPTGTGRQRPCAPTLLRPHPRADRDIPARTHPLVLLLQQAGWAGRLPLQLRRSEELEAREASGTASPLAKTARARDTPKPPSAQDARCAPHSQAWPITDYDIILIPINWSKHWTLGAIDLHQKTIGVYDSLHYNNEDKLKVLLRWLRVRPLKPQQAAGNSPTPSTHAQSESYHNLFRKDHAPIDVDAFRLVDCNDSAANQVPNACTPHRPRPPYLPSGF